MEKYFTVFSVSAFKFILGPVTGYFLELSQLETIITTVLGMMATVIIIAYAGSSLRDRVLRLFFRKRRIFSPRNRKVVKIWRKYGVWGVAFLTPLLFSPPIGAAIAVSFGEKKMKIFSSMLASAIFWGIFFTYLVLLGGEKVTYYFS